MTDLNIRELYRLADAGDTDAEIKLARLIRRSVDVLSLVSGMSDALQTALAAHVVDDALADLVGEHIDPEELVGHLDLEEIAAHVDIDTDDIANSVAENISVYDVANEIADSIDASEVAENLNIDANDVAQAIDVDDVASALDLDDLSDVLVRKLDLEDTIRNLIEELTED